MASKQKYAIPVDMDDDEDYKFDQNANNEIDMDINQEYHSEDDSNNNQYDDD